MIEADVYGAQECKAFLLEHVRTGTCIICQRVFVRSAEEKCCEPCLQVYRELSELMENTPLGDISFFVRPRDMGFVERYSGYDAGRG